jgi:hypothetical protein
MADNLLQEVDQALRADHAAALWAKHRNTIIAAIAGVILLTAANSVWQHFREVRGGETLQALIESQKLLDDGKPAEALALVWQSRALMAQGKKTEAVDALKIAVADGDSLWADIACLRLGGLDAKAATCLDAKKNSPLASTRAEWAAAQAWAKGDRKVAIASIEKLIADKDTSAEARERLAQWLASMNAQEGKKE